AAVAFVRQVRPDVPGGDLCVPDLHRFGYDWTPLRNNSKMCQPRIYAPYRPFMIDICQGQTELSSPSSRRRVVSSRSLIGRALYPSYRSVFVFVQFVYSAPSFWCLV